MLCSTNQSYHWKLNQSEVSIYARLSNQIVRRGMSCNTSASEQYIHFFFIWFHFSFFFHFIFFSFHFFFILFYLFFYISLIISDIFFHTTFSTSNNTKFCTMVVASTGFSKTLMTNCSLLVYFSWTFYL